MAELELRHLKAVRAVADAGSVTKAAARLGLSQPALTAQLRRMDGILGGWLFDRGVQGVAPTELGRFVVYRADVLISDMNLLVSSARERMEEHDVLRVASVPLLLLGGFVDEIRCSGRWADLQSMVEGSSSTVLQLLGTGRADVGIFERFDGMDHQVAGGAELRRFVSKPVYIALSEADPLAGGAEVELGDLASRDWVVPPPHEHGIRGMWLGACDRAGFTPRMRHFTSDASTARTLVERGAVSEADASSKGGGGIVIRPLAGTPLVVETMFGARRDVLGDAVEDLFACAARAYVQTISRNPHYVRWWREHPESHSEIDAALEAL
jgi:DNA-binding transcriptional LysR family regulator